jgi:integrase
VAFLALAGLVLGARIPRTALQRRIDRKRRAIAEQLPEVIDLVAGRSPDDPLLAQRKTRNGLIVELRAICTELGIAYRRVHGLRHSWVTRLLSHGVPLALVQRMAGHRSIATTQQYIDVADGARGWVDRL